MLCCDLDLECSNQFFFTGHTDTLAYNDVSSDQVWFSKNQQLRRYSTRSHTLIMWALDLEDSKHFLLAWHSISWCCITIPSLVTQCCAVQKTSCRQTHTDILNIWCDLDLERSNPVFSHNTLAYNAVLSNQVWLQMDQQFRRYSRNSHILL